MGMIDALWGRDLIPAGTYENWARTCVKGDPDAYYSKVTPTHIHPPPPTPTHTPTPETMEKWPRFHLAFI